RYIAYVLRPSGEPAWADLGEGAAIDRDVERLRKQVSAADEMRKTARILHDRLFAPLRPLLGDARRVVISPDGALNLLPFGALSDEEGRWLVERFSISYVTSGRDLLRAPGPAARSPALLVGAPAFADGKKWPALPGTEAEVAAF